MFGNLPTMATAPTIRISVPGTLRYRGIAVRAVAESARLVSGSTVRDPNDPLVDDVRHPFDTAVVSAFMEIFNNVAIHAYRRKGGGMIDIAITATDADLLVEVRDTGHPFELDEASLPEGGMGLHIAKTMLDEVTYKPGPPNLWRLYKRLDAPQAATAGRS